ncbi:Sodium/calcium exchanger protein-domain-containing protein [Pelagophyceae sp. CCMP2097]|nr:Sodium/calcium exchanger protein-domain-containing protein [Pelagophyceae sp. CCMP2097]
MVLAVSLLVGFALLVGVAYLFFGLAVICDEFLAPLERLAEALRIPTHVAAVTLVAFGSSAPELAISVVGATTNNTEASIPTVLASALIAFGLIPALVVLAVGGPVTLQFQPLVRDTCAYLVGLVLLIYVYFNRSGSINMADALGLVAVYVVYLAIVWTPWTRPFQDGDAAEPLLNATVLDVTVVRSPAPAPDESDVSAEKADEAGKADEVRPAKDGAEFSCSDFVGLLRRPWSVVFRATVRGGPVPAFFVTLAWIGLTSWAAMYLTTLVANCFYITAATAGLTLLAFGAQIPDLIAAIELARNGLADSGIAQALGSQVINVTLGLGLPFAIYTAASGKNTDNENSSVIQEIGYILIFLIAIVFASLLPTLKRGEACLANVGECCGADRRRLPTFSVTLTPFHSKIFCVLFALAYAGCIFVAEY